MTPHEAAEAYADKQGMSGEIDGDVNTGWTSIVEDFLAGFAHAQSDPETMSRFLHEKRMEQSQNTIEALQIGIDQLQKQLDEKQEELKETKELNHDLIKTISERNLCLEIKDSKIETANDEIHRLKNALSAEKAKVEYAATKLAEADSVISVLTNQRLELIKENYSEWDVNKTVTYFEDDMFYKLRKDKA